MYSATSLTTANTLLAICRAGVHVRQMRNPRPKQRQWRRKRKERPTNAMRRRLMRLRMRPNWRYRQLAMISLSRLCEKFPRRRLRQQQLRSKRNLGGWLPKRQQLQKRPPLLPHMQCTVLLGELPRQAPSHLPRHPHLQRLPQRVHPHPRAPQQQHCLRKCVRQ